MAIVLRASKPQGTMALPVSRAARPESAESQRSPVAQQPVAAVVEPAVWDACRTLTAASTKGFGASRSSVRWAGPEVPQVTLMLSLAAAARAGLPVLPVAQALPVPAPATMAAALPAAAA
jgi:hypothetical protein